MQWGEVKNLHQIRYFFWLTSKLNQKVRSNKHFYNRKKLFGCYSMKLRGINSRLKEPKNLIFCTTNISRVKHRDMKKVWYLLIHIIIECNLLKKIQRLIIKGIFHSGKYCPICDVPRSLNYAVSHKTRGYLQILTKYGDIIFDAESRADPEISPIFWLRILIGWFCYRNLMRVVKAFVAQCSII